jgi:quinol-cytochrome oxidoreductase complex cytochrome b subunit
MFSVSFVLAFAILQVFSGMLLTMYYTPRVEWNEISSLPSKVEFVSPSIILPLIIALLAGGIAFGATKLFNKRV